MKYTSSHAIFVFLLLGVGHAAWGQQIYRCTGAIGSAPEYTNNVKDAQARSCKLVMGGNVTVMQGAPVPKTPVRNASPAVSGNPSPRPEGSSAEQRSRDSDSRGILESELKKSEAKLAELQKEYNNGEPEKQGVEGRNYQRYLDRVKELKESIVRSESDIAGLKREISRLPAAN